ncbi:hypothetical protein PIB30_005011 [Stylosanthes scabra]|uniref:Uncharacterized protein n=1 Tax=Stylosanthes scabra TaxID=79078 RepID=A0ABU6Y2H7_9FABA|nr:hypothetical protein [Stylosanthes scabra]
MDFLIFALLPNLERERERARQKGIRKKPESLREDGRRARLLLHCLCCFTLPPPLLFPSSLLRENVRENSTVGVTGRSSSSAQGRIEKNKARVSALRHCCYWSSSFSLLP